MNRHLLFAACFASLCAAASARSPKSDRYDEGDPNLAKISAKLLRARREEKAGGRALDKMKEIAPDAIFDGRIQINVRVAKVTDALTQAIEAAGGAVVGRHPDVNIITAQVDSLAQVEAIAALADVTSIQPEYGPILMAGSVTSQGDAAMWADAARSRTGATGAGVRVGVMSDTINRTRGGTITNGILTGSTPQTSGDLPAQIHVLDPGPDTGSDEGAAMLEIVHDVAPDAELYFASAGRTYNSFRDNVLALVNAGVDVIVDDILWPQEPAYQDGPIATSINTALLNGVACFSAAGNFGDNAYESPFVDVNSAANDRAALPTGEDLHDFGGGNRFMRVSIPTGGYIKAILHWNEPYSSTSGAFGSGPGSAADLDLFLLKAPTLPVTSVDQAAEYSNDVQGDLQAPQGDPFEYLRFTNTGAAATFYLCIERYTDPPGANNPTAMSLVMQLGGGATILDSQYLGYRSIYGHSAVAGNNTVGAIFWAEIEDTTGPIGEIEPPAGQYNVEYFSSVGGALPFYFDGNGVALTGAPLYRLKPDLTAPDGGNTSFFGSQIGDGDSFPNFFGTSAAAPHAAGVAALMRQRVIGLPPAKIHDVMTRSSYDIDIPGFDVLSGYGFLDAENAVSSVPNGAQFLDSTVPSEMLANQHLPAQIKVRNIGTTTWTKAANYRLEIKTDTCNLAGGATRIDLPDAVSIAPDQEYTFTMNLQAGASAADCQFEVQMIKEFVERFSLPLNHAVKIGSGFSEGFEGLGPGWLGGVLQGGLSVAMDGSGLCMTTAASGENVMGWISPEGYAPLVDRRVIRVRAGMNTDQTAVDAIPLWDMIYDNFNSSGYGGAYAGETIFIDQSGGANGVGRSQGRTQFESYAMPVAAETLQWRGLLNNGVAGENDNSAFTPSADAFNDIRIGFRILDQDSAGVLAQNDFGRVCVSYIRMDGYQLDALIPGTVLWGPKLGSATHAAQTLTQGGEGAGTATIDNDAGTILYQLTQSGAGSRKTLFPFDSASFNSQNPGAYGPLYPILWEANTLMKGTMLLRSAVSGGAEGNDPIDAIFVNSDVPSNEIVNIHVALRGSPGNLHYAASPRRSSSTGGQDQPYSSFFYGHNVTAYDTSLAPNINHLRFQGDFFNTAEIGIDGVGANPVMVSDFRVVRYTLPQ